MKRFVLIFVAIVMSISTFAQDPNFHIYLCFGQSNMEGNARIQPQDSLGISDNMLTLAVCDYRDGSRTAGQWYKALPPLCRYGNGLSPADYFGRAMIEHFPEGHRVGIINIAIGGCDIIAFNPEEQEDYAVNKSPIWMKRALQAYGNRPYDKLVEMGKLAQKEGVIDAILLHQGETNTEDPQWPVKVKYVYECLIRDLGLKAEDCPLIVGEVVNEDMGGVCADCNKMISVINETIPTAYPVSSSKLTTAEKLHFDAQGYRDFGRRYADVLIKVKYQK